MTALPSLSQMLGKEEVFLFLFCFWHSGILKRTRPFLQVTHFRQCLWISTPQKRDFGVRESVKLKKKKNTKLKKKNHPPIELQINLKESLEYFN